MADAKANSSGGASGAAPAGASEKKFDVKKIAAAGFILMNLVVTGGGAYLAYAATLGWQRPSVREPAAIKELEALRDSEGVRESILYTMPTFTVNLEGQPKRMLRVEMTLEMLDEAGFEEVVRLSPKARDQIMRILNAKTYNDLETIQGKLFLKDEIAVALNTQLNEAVVKDVYFSDFLVQ